MRRRGSILIGVLWCMVLLSVLVIGVLHTARMDLLVVKNYGDRVQAHYLALAGVERAKALLRRRDLSVTDVCFEVGWTSLGSFSARFTELVGESPSKYRARDHDELRVLPTCQAMVVTRPRRGGARAGRKRAVSKKQPVGAPA